MTIRSYKDIFAQFQRMFPELAKMSKGWKGVVFKRRHIVILMNDDSVIDFLFGNENQWTLAKIPKETRKAVLVC